jgi:Uma2 family endonuclease
MTVMATRSDVDLGMIVPTADERVVLACDWTSYEVQLALRGGRSRPKLAFLDGELEIMSPSPHHERIKSRIGMIIEAYLVYANLKGSEWWSDDAALEGSSRRRTRRVVHVQQVR